MWETVIAILVALLGGGIINLLLGWIKERRSSAQIRKMFASEIYINTKNAVAVEQSVHAGRFSTMFYRSNGDKLTVFPYDVSILVVSFYGCIEAMQECETKENAERHMAKGLSTGLSAKYMKEKTEYARRMRELGVKILVSIEKDYVALENTPGFLPPKPEEPKKLG